MGAIKAAMIAAEERGIDTEAEDALDRLWWALAQEDMEQLAATFPYALSVDIDKTVKRIEAAWCGECGTKQGPFVFSDDTEVCAECHDALTDDEREEEPVDCKACGEKFGPDEECENCGALDGESDVDRIIRGYEESIEALQAELDELRTAVREAHEQAEGSDLADEVEDGSEEGKEAVRLLRGLLYDLAGMEP